MVKADRFTPSASDLRPYRLRSHGLSSGSSRTSRVLILIHGHFPFISSSFSLKNSPRAEVCIIPIEYTVDFGSDLVMDDDTVILANDVYTEFLIVSIASQTPFVHTTRSSLLSSSGALSAPSADSLFPFTNVPFDDRTSLMYI